MRRAILASLLVCLCAGCETPKYVATSKPLCRAVQTVLISKNDQMTEETASQIEANNLGRAKVCK